MDALAPFRIPAAILKADEASYEWKLGPDFLAIFDEEHEGITGHFEVHMELHREGKHGDPADSTDEVVFIDSDSSDLNVGQHIYDFILLSVPISHRIPDCDQMENSPCDTSILTYLSQNQVDEMPKGDKSESPWDDLKKQIDN